MRCVSVTSILSAQVGIACRRDALARVADLPARLGVEGRPVEHNGHFIARTRELHRFAPHQQRRDLCLRCGMPIGQELGRRQRPLQLREGIVRRRRRHPSRCWTLFGRATLLLHRLLEARHIDGEAAFRRDLLRHLRGKP